MASEGQISYYRTKTCGQANQIRKKKWLNDLELEEIRRAIDEGEYRNVISDDEHQENMLSCNLIEKHNHKFPTRLGRWRNYNW